MSGGALTLLAGSGRRRAPTPDLAARIGDLLRAPRPPRRGASGSTRSPRPAGAATRRSRRTWRGSSPITIGNIAEAVTIAERAAAERHDIFTDDALAWAYFKAGRVADARVAIARALRTGTRDADIRAHAALSAAR